MTTTCPITGEQLPPGRTISTSALGWYRNRLLDLGDYMRDLDTARTRQTRYAAQPGNGDGDGLPWSEHVSTRAHVPTATILMWADDIARRTGVTVPQTWPGIQRLLTRTSSWLATQHDAAHAVDEITYALAIIAHLIDRPADVRYAGTCADCGQHLYTLPDRTETTCLRCARHWDVQAQRQAMLDQIDDTPLTAHQASLAIATHGLTCSPATIRQWKRRGLIAPVGANAAGHPTYRLADILDRLTDKIA